jgi:hypothetical protein
MNSFARSRCIDIVDVVSAGSWFEFFSAVRHVRERALRDLHAELDAYVELQFHLFESLPRTNLFGFHALILRREPLQFFTLSSVDTPAPYNPR